MSDWSKKASDKQQTEQAAVDVEWFADRLAVLVAELRTTKEPNRQRYIRGCIRAAMKAHEQLTAGMPVLVNEDNF